VDFHGFARLAQVWRYADAGEFVAASIHAFSGSVALPCRFSTNHVSTVQGEARMLSLLGTRGAE
jgi:hypothetical protein